MSQENQQLQFLEVQFFTFANKQSLNDQDDSFEAFPQSSEKSDQTSMLTQYQTNPSIFIQDSVNIREQHSTRTYKHLTTKSVLHNMQKHLFTFLQSLISTQGHINIQTKNENVQKCTEWILKRFKNKKKKTKENIVPLLKQLDRKQMSRIQQFSQMLEKYDQETLRESLGLIKKFIMSQISTEFVKVYLERSKISKKGEFEKYVQTFVEEVREGRFKCRLSKRSQEQIKTKIIEERRQNEWANVIS